MLRVACQGHRGHTPSEARSTIAAVSSGNGVQPSGSMPLEMSLSASSPRSAMHCVTNRKYGSLSVSHRAPPMTPQNTHPFLEANMRWRTTATFPPSNGSRGCLPGSPKQSCVAPARPSL